MELDIFSDLKIALDRIVSSSYLAIPELENLTTIIAYIIGIWLFLLFFTLPIKLLRILFGQDTTLKASQKKRFFKK